MRISAINLSLAIFVFLHCRQSEAAPDCTKIIRIPYSSIRRNSSQEASVPLEASGSKKVSAPTKVLTPSSSAPIKTGLQCFSCSGSGMDDACVTDQVNGLNNVSTCRDNEYCVVVRKELRNLRTNGHVAHLRIWRGCMSYSVLKNNLETTKTENRIDSSTVKYTQFCQSDYCNSGNGLLRCYECTGIGLDHPCMKDTDKVVTCPPNHFCSTMRSTYSVNTSTNILYSDPLNETLTSFAIARNCKPHVLNRRINSIEYPYSLKYLFRRFEVAQSCTTDLCNSIKGDNLSPFYNASVMTRSPWNFGRFIRFTRFLTDPFSNSAITDGRETFFKNPPKHMRLDV